MSIRYSSAASAAVLLIAALCGPSSAVADGYGASVEACMSGQNVMIRTSGHPGKFAYLPRRDQKSLPRCTASTEKGLMLVSFTDAAGGKALTAGNVDRAMRELTTQTRGTPPVSLLNNLCVAHTVQHEWAEARDACDAAVAAAADQRAEARRWSSERRRLANKVAAAVYSNRAVMNWLSNDALAAQGDIASARSIAPKENFVVRNAELAARLPARVEYASQPVG